VSVNPPTDSTFVRHLPCPNCNSSDANSEYTDGHTYCFACDTTVQPERQPDGQQSVSGAKAKTPLDLIRGKVHALTKRGITEETCQKFGYSIGEYKGKPVQIAPYFNADGQLVAQKVRFADKSFKVLGSFDDALPFGAQCWQRSGKMIVVTEGEIDALSMSQVQGNKWPVVSIGCGAGGQIKKYIAKHREYFLGFDKVVLMFDTDEPGRKAAEEAARIIGSRSAIAVIPEYKDANEALLNGAAQSLISSMWNALPYKPDGIVEMASLEEAVKTPPVVGLSFPWESLTKLFYGIHLNAIYTLGAGTGTGKTDLYTQIAEHIVTVHKKPIGMFYLESATVETARRLAGKAVGKTFHVPDSGWTDADVERAWQKLAAGGKVFLYDSFGIAEWTSICDKIEYLYHAEGVQYFFLDHLTALAQGEDERVKLEEIMANMGGLVQKLPITIFLVSHLSTPEGKPHEEGGRVFLRHFKGSRTIGFWSVFAFGLERNQQAEDVRERCTTTFRVLKDRLTGRATGEVMYLFYDRETGRLEEVGPPDGGKVFTEEKPTAPDKGVSDF
jgi:twinkle protein